MSAASWTFVPDARAPSGPGVGWPARLGLGFELRGGRTVLARKAHEGPLMVQSPFYPEGPVCHLYLLHPPGGVVGGDRLRVEGRLLEGAHALLTTPAATKVYRSAGPGSRIEHELHVAPGATLEWLPQRTLVFSGARAHASTRVCLRGPARFIGWEALCLGRPAAGEGFEQGVMRQDFELWKDGEPLMVERNALDAAAPLMHAAWGLASHRALASLLLHPAEEHLLPVARAVLEGFEAGEAGATRVDGVLACRVLSDDMARVWDLLVRLWRTLRPRFLAREAVAPRIWAV